MNRFLTLRKKIKTFRQNFRMQTELGVFIYQKCSLFFRRTDLLREKRLHCKKTNNTRTWSVSDEISEEKNNEILDFQKDSKKNSTNSNTVNGACPRMLERVAKTAS